MSTHPPVLRTLPTDASSEMVAGQAPAAAELRDVNGRLLMATLAAEQQAETYLEAMVEVRDVSDGVVLTVRDTGIGLPAGQAERIFEPFCRASNALALGLPGIGLGLHISRQITEIHDGTLRAESCGEGFGMSMVLWLPTSGTGEPSRAG